MSEEKREAEAKAKAKIEEKARIKAEAKEELKKEARDKAKSEAKERDLKIKEIQKKKKRSEEEKAFLKREMLVRAKENRDAPKDLDKLYPSQMTLKEMETYCKRNEIKVEKGDTTVLLRLRIKAKRNPAQAERLRLLEKMPVEGRIIR